MKVRTEKENLKKLAQEKGVEPEEMPGFKQLEKMQRNGRRVINELEHRVYAITGKQLENAYDFANVRSFVEIKRARERLEKGLPPDVEEEESDGELKDFTEWKFKPPQEIKKKRFADLLKMDEEAIEDHGVTVEYEANKMVKIYQEMCTYEKSMDPSE